MFATSFRAHQHLRIMHRPASSIRTLPRIIRSLVIISMPYRITTAVARILLVFSIVTVTVVAFLAARDLIALFATTSYRLVALFLVAILASNILAKLSRAYLEL